MISKLRAKQTAANENHKKENKFLVADESFDIPFKEGKRKNLLIDLGVNMNFNEEGNSQIVGLGHASKLGDMDTALQGSKFGHGENRKPAIHHCEYLSKPLSIKAGNPTMIFDFNIPVKPTLNIPK